MPWDERKGPALTSDGIIRSLNASFAEIPEARVFAVGPPAIPGISATGGFSMMIQDRSGADHAKARPIARVERDRRVK